MAWGKPDFPIIPKPFGQVIKEFNEEAKIIIGVDAGAGDDKTVIALHDGVKSLVIGEDVELTIPINAWKSVTVRVICIQDLAIYMGDEEDVGLVIHVPTLTKFDNAIPDCPSPLGYTQDQMITWCWKVQQTDRIYFKELSRFNHSTYKNIEKFMLEALQQYCLSIKVE